MDKRKQKHGAVRNSKNKNDSPNGFEQVNQESLINHEETMLIDVDSQETITINQKDQWTEMEQSIQAALMSNSNDDNSMKINQDINTVQGVGVDEIDNDMISVDIDYEGDSEIEGKNDKKVPDRPAQLTEEAIRKLDEEFYRHDMAIKQIAQDLNIDISWTQKYVKDHHESVTIGHKRRKSGYNVFQATEWWPNHKEEFNSSFGAESNRACGIAWRSLSESDKHKYEEKAALENEKIKGQFDQIENSRKRHTQAQTDINSIKTTIRSMEKKCGLEVAMLIAPNRSDDSFSARFVGTSGGEAFFSASPEMYSLLDKFEIYTKNRHLEQTGQIVTQPAKRVRRELSTTSGSELSHSPIAVSSTHRNINSADVKARVRAILRARYNSALGTEGLIIPYKKWKDHQGEIEVIGWPVDVPFDDFGVLKVAQKKQILDCLNDISFRKKEDKIIL